MNKFWRCHRCRLGIILVAVLAGGCESIGRTDFERHSMSSLKILPDRDDGLLLFEAKTNAQYPDSPSGDVQRMKWATAWMEIRGFCPQGFSVVSRRRYTPADDNPYRYHLRYELRCLSPPE